jgi:glucose/arabinose dehydrogenase
MSNCIVRLVVAIGLVASFVLGSASHAQPLPADVPFTQIVSGLSTPIGITNLGDGSGRLFINQQGGAIRIVRRDGSLVATPYLSLTSGFQCRPRPGEPLERVGFTSGGERGLLGVAFHPQFASNGLLFLSFSDFRNSASGSGVIGDTMVVRITIAPENRAADVVSTADLESCVVVLRADQDYTNHNGGQILFGPDGFLYVFLGDGGSGNDPCNRSQTLDPALLTGAATGGSGQDCAADTVFVNSGGDPNSRALLGKILRIDPTGTTTASTPGICGAATVGQQVAYSIPPGQPSAVGGTIAAACDEVYAYGVRNPWRNSFDRLTNDLLLGDVGQDSWEEISLMPAANLAGANFDWRTCEARHVRGSCVNLCPAQDVAEVIISYSTRNTCSTGDFGGSITGGYRYRGPDTSLQGVYFYGDATRSRVYYSALVGSAWTPTSQASSLPTAGNLAGTVLSFGEQENGELYVVGGGTLYRIGAAAPLDRIFASSFE